MYNTHRNITNRTITWKKIFNKNGKLPFIIFFELKRVRYIQLTKILKYIYFSLSNSILLTTFLIRNFFLQYKFKKKVVKGCRGFVVKFCFSQKFCMGYCSISYISVITPYTLTLHLTLKICMNAFEFNSNIFNKIQNENFSVCVCKKRNTYVY